jgi:hypothetical protein
VNWRRCVGVTALVAFIIAGCRVSPSVVPSPDVPTTTDPSTTEPLTTEPWTTEPQTETPVVTESPDVTIIVGSVGRAP